MNVVDRLAVTGISPFRAWQHVVAGRVLLDGQPVLDPTAQVELTAVVTLTSGPGHVRPDALPPPWLGPRGPQRGVTDGTPAVTARVS